ncbi:MAG: hypothetical protein ACUVX8_01215 [Candidatus Zipacnadales bacterium]
MRRSPRFRRLALFTATVILIAGLFPPNYVYAAQGYRIGQRWVYDWAWQGYYVLYNTYCYRGAVYTIQVVPETRVDDPDLYVGTSRPQGTNKPWCSPHNYLWKSTRGAGSTDSIRFRAGYTGVHYFCVYAYAPNWTGWYVRVKRW